MSVASERELELRNEDLVTAMQAIGRVLVDPTLKPAQRTERVLGILSRYDCAPATPKKESPS